jgi:hypothetical protein
LIDSRKRLRHPVGVQRDIPLFVKAVGGIAYAEALHMRTSFFPAVLLSVVTTTQAFGEPVATRMRNVVFHFPNSIEVHVTDLSGRLQSRTAGKPPVFDDVNSYLLEVDSARLSMTPASLTNLMNNYVFAGSDSPFKNLKITIENGELIQSGTLKKGVNVPFTMRGTIGVTPDGMIRIHPTTIKAAGFLSKNVLHFFGLHLDRLVKLKNTSAVKVDHDDLVLDPQNLLPPPRIRGRVTNAWIQDGLIVEQFGNNTKASALAPPYYRGANYMYYRGGTLKFGKLTMEDTDLLLVDEESKDPFDFSPEKYNEQLVAGYSKNTKNHGLIVFMPDLKTLHRSEN